MRNVVKDLRSTAGMTQAELADAAETSQPTIAAYESGAKSPNLRTLERLARATGRDLVVSFVPPLTREDRRSLKLHMAIAERLIENPAGVLRRARRNLRHMREQHPDAGDLLGEWKRILERSPAEIVEVLTDPGIRARDLRQVTPFAGVLSPGERARLYAQFREEERHEQAGV